MQRIRTPRFVAISAGLALLGAAAGCGDGLSRYAPTETEARSSLEAALSAWRDGKAFGEVEAKPPVRPVDSAWQSGEKLESFEIGKQGERENGIKEFTVKIAMKGVKESKDVRYIVHGRDPVWVYREEDYNRTQNMENATVTPAKSKKVAKRPGSNR
jgi:hypothetical protein